GTICHRGSGEALDFVRADHRPDTAAEQTEWHEDHHWHKQHHWDYPMLQRSMTEASCVQCHKSTMELIAKDAPTVTRGYRLVERYGCFACHNVAPWDGEEPKVRDMSWVAAGTNEHGPNLRGVAAKVRPEWLYAWIKDPQTYWPDTRMPNLRLSDQDAADITAFIVEDP